ncbi:MAG: hypothetical protein A2096_00565 [Spirochaetes bacterium GWF1_41_5]|nr:MAG: hypothetical protein A2096_00565 [Spirochaetes bacterium GWF1_41_5]
MKNKLLLKDYKNLISRGIKINDSVYTYFIQPQKNTIIKAAASKNAGSAVKRNYEKRVIRSIFREITLKENYILLAICRKKNQYTYLAKKNLIEKSLSAIVKTH